MGSHNKYKDFIDVAISSNNFKSISDNLTKSLASIVDISKSSLDRLSHRLNSDRINLPANKNSNLVKQDKNEAKSFRHTRNISAFISGSILLGFLDTLFNPEGLGELVITFILSLFFAGFSYYNHIKYKRTLRFYRYREEIGNSRVVNVEDFASAVGMSVDECAKDLMDLIKKGYFPQARLVENGRLFLLDRGSYSAYKDYYLKKAKKIEEDKKEEIDKINNSDDLTNLNAYIEEISLQIERIENESFKNHVKDLQTLLLSVKNQLDKRSLKDMGLEKFIDYYIPTAIKLINSYLDFEKSDLDFENLVNSMDEIEKSILTIKSAFISVLEESYTEDIININSEIDVMNTILTQDGLLDENNIYKRDRKDI